MVELSRLDKIETLSVRLGRSKVGSKEVHGRWHSATMETSEVTSEDISHFNFSTLSTLVRCISKVLVQEDILI